MNWADQIPMARIYATIYRASGKVVNKSQRKQRRELGKAFSPDTGKAGRKRKLKEP